MDGPLSVSVPKIKPEAEGPCTALSVLIYTTWNAKGIREITLLSKRTCIHFATLAAHPPAVHHTKTTAVPACADTAFSIISLRR